jgi:hypothetical protein
MVDCDTQNRYHFAGELAAPLVVVVGAPSAFAYRSHHRFSSQLDRWMTQHAVTADALTDALIMMAVVVLLTRTLGVAARASSLPMASERPMPTHK